MTATGTPTPVPTATLPVPGGECAGAGAIVLNGLATSCVADELVDVDRTVEDDEESPVVIEVDDMNKLVEEGFTPIVMRADG